MNIDENIKYNETLTTFDNILKTEYIKKSEDEKNKAYEKIKKWHKKPTHFLFNEKIFPKAYPNFPPSVIWE